MSDISSDPLPVESPAQPQGVGATLRQARMQAGKSLNDVAEGLRIRQQFLQALEEGRHRDLPGGAYAIGFLRTYADFLGLDAEEMVRRFRAEASGALNPRSELSFPSPQSEGRIPGGAVLFIGLVLAGLGYGGWYFLSQRDVSVAERTPSLPDRLASVLGRQANVVGETTTPPPSPRPDAAPASADTDVPDATPEPTSVQGGEVIPPSEEAGPAKTADAAKPAEPASSAKPAEPAFPVKPVESTSLVRTTDTASPKPTVGSKPAEPVSGIKPAEPVSGIKPTEPVSGAEPASGAKPAEPVGPKPADVAKTVVPPAGKPADPVQAGAKPAAEEASRIQLLAANDDCWIQVREMDGQLLVSRLLRRGEGYAVPNRPGLTLMAGNAGALELTVDGQRLPSLGSPGQVRRDIRLDPAKLLAN